MKEFKVAAISSNRNAFGLKGMVLVAQDGEAWQVGANDLNVRKVGEVIRADRNWSGYGFEIPERLPEAPPRVVREVWKKDYKGTTFLFNMKKSCKNPNVSCVVCGGDLVPMGQLGNLKWFRCRACGMEQSRKVRRSRPLPRTTYRGPKEGDYGSRFNKRKIVKRNPIEPVGGGHMITGQSIQLYRLLALKHAMSLELKTGMKMSRGINPFKIVKQEFGFKGNKQKIYDQLVAYIDQVGPGLAQKNPYRAKSGRYSKRGGKKLRHHRVGGRVTRGWKGNDGLRDLKYWNCWMYDHAFGKQRFIGKVRAKYAEIKRYFPGARLGKTDDMVGCVYVTKKSQMRLPAKVRK